MAPRLSELCRRQQPSSLEHHDAPRPMAPDKNAARPVARHPVWAVDEDAIASAAVLPHGLNVDALGGEDLNVIALPVRHEDLPVGADGDPAWHDEVALAGAPAPEHAQKITLRIKGLDPKVSLVNHEDGSVARDGYVKGAVKLPRALPLAAKGAHKGPVPAQHLHAVRCIVRHEHVTSLVKGDAVGACKLAVAVPLLPDGAQVGP
eukprot:CAMPEP_0174939706 /NCGR_PEP_ID=MMETSP1355-20121228/67318_1 /TAXON_ID=464990 /ORGANISM="Hemiselmis tepida, Strain CCMP443" /LENGTH=204 /DNA_ID=CAMNT_0016186741 /DNA_START=29 /DNA_END=644 /DNA_ORIENTATION=-